VATHDSQTVIARCRELAGISDIASGTFRQFLSPAMKRCYQVVGEWMKAAGLSVSIDNAGNLRGVRSGVVPGKRVFLMGSHLDTVRDAGAFDGILGVILAIAVVENLPNVPLPFDIEVIGFSEEEGVRFNLPFIGSRALVGTLDEHAVAVISPALREFGLDPAKISDVKLKTPPIGFLEFHIEQGPILEHVNESVGLVDAIAGQTRATLKFTGSANHAGTTPMHLRQDALAAGAQWITIVEHIACTTPNLVATNGKIELQPNLGNVIPGEVTVSLDVRHSDDEVRENACALLRHSAAHIAAERMLTLSWTETLNQRSVPMNDSLTRKLETAAPQGIRRMVSGAGHDAMILAPYIPSAMLFLRSPGGISHHPAESVLPQDVDLALSIGQRFIESLAIEYKS
jgi:allantoate deiminase